MSETQPSPGDLIFLPQPWRVTRNEGWLLLDGATPIRVAGGASDATIRTARGLQQAIQAQTGIAPTDRGRVPRRDTTGRAGITLVLVDRDEASFPAETMGWNDPTPLLAQGSTLVVSEDGATVAANDEAGLFYGAQTLIQLVKGHDRRLPSLRIEDRPALPVRGLMLDVTRGKVLTRETLTTVIETDRPLQDEPAPALHRAHLPLPQPPRDLRGRQPADGRRPALPGRPLPGAPHRVHPQLPGAGPPPPRPATARLRPPGRDRLALEFFQRERRRVRLHRRPVRRVPAQLHLPLAERRRRRAVGYGPGPLEGV